MDIPSHGRFLRASIKPRRPRRRNPLLARTIRKPQERTAAATVSWRPSIRN